jgi:hypothetical protein
MQQETKDYPETIDEISFGNIPNVVADIHVAGCNNNISSSHMKQGSKDSPSSKIALYPIRKPYK